MARRCDREPLDADTFVRHYEDAAQIARAMETLPDIRMTPAALAKDMLKTKDIASLPKPDEPALLLEDPVRRRAIREAHTRIKPMFWGPRIPLDEACAILRSCLSRLDE